jgi:hypothetical protein
MRALHLSNFSIWFWFQHRERTILARRITFCLRLASTGLMHFGSSAVENRLRITSTDPALSRASGKAGHFFPRLSFSSLHSLLDHSVSDCMT